MRLSYALMNTATPTDHYLQFMNGVLRQATDAGHQLRLEPIVTGYSWEWSNGWSGETTSYTKAVALYEACCGYMDHVRGTTGVFTYSTT